MLFLAVFCGFLAEYQLEHTIENQREKKLIRSLVHDLTADTIRLHTIINSRTEKELIMDSLSALINATPVFKSTGTIYNYAVWAPRTAQYRFLPNEGTMQQLKNAGGLRLIRKLFVADSITSYDAAVRMLLRQQEVEETAVVNYAMIAHKFFDGRVFNRMMNSDNIPMALRDNPPLSLFTKADLPEFNYRLFLLQAQNRVQRRQCKQLLIKAQFLMALLKKEYNLK